MFMWISRPSILLPLYASYIYLILDYVDMQDDYANM
jgi:hypothetical protein